MSSYPNQNGLFTETKNGDVARTWYSFMFSFVNGLTGKSFAICSKTSDATIEVTWIPLGAPPAQGMAPDNAAGGVATCPEGSRAIGGGGAIAQPSLVNLSGPVDETGLTANTGDGYVARGWYAYVSNFAPSPQRFNIFAICSKESDAIVEATSFEAGHVSSDVARASCPSGSRALGGGIGTTGPAPAPGGRWSPYQVIESAPVDASGEIGGTMTGEVARGWQSAIFNQSGSPQLFKSFALCARDAIDEPGPSPGPAPGRPTPRCDGRKATIVGTGASERLRGTSKSDVIAGLGGRDKVLGRGGNDRICGGNGNDSLSGGNGNDFLSGGNGNDRLTGGRQRDALKGGRGRDNLIGGPGSDSLNGGPGRDKVRQG